MCYSLPSSPHKQRYVGETLAKYEGLQLAAHQLQLKACENIYNHHDIIWQVPGRKDGIIIQETNEEGAQVKQTEQAKYVMISLREVHQRASLNQNESFQVL